MTTRLDRLRQVREGLETEKPWRKLPVGDVVRACLPGWDVEGRPLGNGRWVLLGPNCVDFVDHPLLTADGALWLAKQALPDELWPPVLVPEGRGQATCKFRDEDYVCFERAPTLALAIVRAVVKVLIDDLETQMEAEREARIAAGVKQLLKGIP